MPKHNSKSDRTPKFSEEDSLDDVFNYIDGNKPANSEEEKVIGKDDKNESSVLENERNNIDVPSAIQPPVESRHEDEQITEPVKAKSGDKTKDNPSSLPIMIGVKKKLPSDVPIPNKPSKNVSCYDLYVDLTGTSYGSSVHIPVGQSRIIPTNLFFDIPVGYELQVRPKIEYVENGVIIQYAPYTLDIEYKEELKIYITNTSKNEVLIKHGQKIAQLAIAPILESVIIEKT